MAASSVNIGGTVLNTLARAFVHPYDTATCAFGPDGVTIQSMDSCHVTLLSAVVHKHDMQAYEFRHPGEPPLLEVVRFDVIQKALRPAKHHDNVCMKIGTARRKRSQTVGIKSSDFIATFAITPSTQDPAEPFAIPALPPKSSVVLNMEIELFKNLFVTADDTVTISATLLAVKIGDREFTVDSDVVAKTVSSTDMTFSSQLFKPFFKGAKAAGAKSIRVSVSKDHAGEFRYTIGTRSCISLHVAPRLDETEEPS